MDKNSRPDQIVLLKEWVEELSPKKVRKELVSCFKALNSIKRYKDKSATLPSAGVVFKGSSSYIAI